jgi:hypothetical protein
MFRKNTLLPSSGLKCIGWGNGSVLRVGWNKGDRSDPRKRGKRGVPGPNYWQLWIGKSCVRDCGDYSTKRESVSKKCGETLIFGNHVKKLVHEAIKSRLHSGNSCWHWVRRFLSCLLSKNVNIKIYQNVILRSAFCAVKISYLTLREEHRLQMFENKVLRGIFG